LGREIAAQFAGAGFASEADVEAFLAGLSEVQSADVLRVLEQIQKGAGDPQCHELRCRAFALVARRAADKGLFLPFVRALKGADPILRATLADLLPAVNSVKDHPELCGLLRSQDVALRGVAGRVLSKVGGRTAFETLEAMVQEPGFPGRGEAIEAAVATAEHRAVPLLEAVLRVGSAAEKLSAIARLIEPRCMALNPAAALKAVATGLADEDEAIVREAVSAIAQIAGEDDYFALVGPLLESPRPSLAKVALEGLRLLPGPRAVEALRKRLRSGPNRLRYVAIDTLEAMGIPEVVGPLVEALGHTRVTVRTRAAETLARMSRAGKLDLARAVIWLLGNRDVNVRRLAVEIASSVRDGSEEFWPKLLGFLRDEDWWVRERVADVLAELAPQQLLRHVAGYLRDPSDVLRRFAVDVLMRLQAPESLGALVRAAKEDADWWVRERAIEAVGALKDLRATPHLVDLMLREAELRVASLQALAAMGAREAAPHVATLLAAEEEDVRFEALRCLRVLGGPAQGSLVAPLLADSAPTLRALARDVLDAWGSGAAPAPGAPAVPGTPAAPAVPLLDQLLIATARMQADDLLLFPNRRPHVKRLGRVVPLAKNVFGPEKVRSMLLPHLSGEQLRDLELLRDVDLSYEVRSEALRFRVNVFRQVGGVSAVFRIIKGAIPELDQLGLPPIVAGFAELKDGLVLVGGPTGAGKSTTLAALVDRINGGSRRHVITLEDPIEVVHARRLGLVNQREVGVHTGLLSGALRSTLRQDPDVILVGELRDLPTISFAVSAAETGHLVFGTIHTVSAAATVDRLINAFPPGQQDHVRALLAGSLRAVVCQYLHRRLDGAGRCLSVEVMLNTEAVANLIRKGKAYQLPSVIATSRQLGMQLMDQELVRLVKDGVIGADDAYMKAENKKEFEAFVTGAPGPESPA
jgi:twitching motility protein PilT